MYKRTPLKSWILLLDYEGNKVPNGFVSWVRIMEQKSNISQKCLEVLNYLEDNELYEALDVYEEITMYNPTKTWH